ncbi:MAG: ribosome biogenesis GTPase YlqF [Bacilli bacterium]|nr:ribosome biogenesis GTPase YlqF [Bacilli bacterium]
MNKEVIKMDMYQKRKIRAEKKNNNQEEKLTKVGINWYPGHMAKTKRLIKENLKYIDIVYEVVDSRMPKSSKLIDIVDYTQGKPRIIIMTKYDLCDKEETKKWIKYYENSGCVVIPVNLEGNNDIKTIIATTEKILNKVYENKKNNGLFNRKARVLVVGVPNVGKSTLINRLAGKKVVGIGNKPGVTKNISWIRVNDKIELLDTPGILWPKLDEDEALNLAALTSIKEENLPLFDVASHILVTLEKFYPDKLKARYGLELLDEDIVISMEKIGKKRGCLIRGGDIDYTKVISLIVGDVKNGYIKGITFDRMDEDE